MLPQTVTKLLSIHVFVTGNRDGPFTEAVHNVQQRVVAVVVFRES
jgi:hypothetical protein